MNASGALADEARIAYWLHCAGCHGLEGRGAPPQVPSLIDEPGRIEALPGGRAYLVRVPGVAQASLADAPLAQVVNFMLQTFSSDSLSAGFQPYDADEIARLRVQTLKDPLRQRSRIVNPRQVGE